MQDVVAALAELKQQQAASLEQQGAAQAKIEQQLHELQFAVRQVASPTVISTIFTSAQFKRLLRDQPSWKGYIAPWWSDISDTSVIPASSDTLASFCSDVPKTDQEKVLQAYLMAQLATLDKKKRRLPRYCNFVDTSVKPLADSTRKPDISMISSSMGGPSVFNLATMISLKCVMDEDATVELTGMLLDLLQSNPRRIKSQCRTLEYASCAVAAGS